MERYLNKISLVHNFIKRGIKSRLFIYNHHHHHHLNNNVCNMHINIHKIVYTVYICNLSSIFYDSLIMNMNSKVVYNAALIIFNSLLKIHIVITCTYTYNIPNIIYYI